MYRPTIKRKKTGVPVLSRKEIDIIGERLIKDFCPDAVITPQEIDIDLFVQDYLGADMDYQYLSHCGVYLGMTVFNDTDKVPVYDPINKCADYISAKAHTVIIDNTLLENNQGHRYRFTMGHEASHDFLHTDYFSYDPNQMTLADFMDMGTLTPMIQCRIDTKKMNEKQSVTWGEREWMEWQANALSSALLMPKSMVDMVVRDVKSRGLQGGILNYVIADTVSSVFNVSFEAATYRLKQLGYISQKVQVSNDLFGRMICGL